MGKNGACALGLVLILAIPANAADPPPARGAPAGRVLELRVVERDGGKPVAGAAIQTQPSQEDEPAFRGTTDDQGRCSVPVPRDVEKARHFAVHAWKDGFVPVRVVWGATREFEFEGVPAAYTVVFDRGTPIGGVVRDERGRPVAGARVFPTFAVARRSEIESIELPWNTSFTSDAQGRWRCAILPASCETGEVALRVEHPRFLGGGRGFDRPLPINDLRALTAALVMETGFTLRGTVADPNGRPIEGAAVVCRRADGKDVRLPGKSGPGGGFQIENLSPGIVLITAEVPGLATGVKQVHLGPPAPYHGPRMLPAGLSPLVAPRPPAEGVPIASKPPAEGVPTEPTPPAPAIPPGFLPSDAEQLARGGPCEPPLVFRLGPGRTIRGRVVDTRGRPIAGARVTPEVRGCSDLLDWRAETDADGRFEWANAPREDIVLNVENAAEGQEIRCLGPGARDGEIVVTMPAPFLLRGKVVDADTGRPIDRFRLVEGIVWTHDFATEDDENPPEWSLLGRGEAFAGGGYEVRFPRPRLSCKTPYYPLLVIRIEVEGYAPVTSRKYGIQEGEQTCDFALRKQTWIKGTVHAPDGSPVAGAEVVVAVKGRPAPYFDNGRLAAGWRGDAVRTDPDGRFAFAKPDAGGRVVVVSDRGLAQRTVDELAAEPVVTLQPWGRIRGQVRVGSGVGPRRLVSAIVAEPDYRGQPVVSFTARTLTDAEGRFALERVAPGHAMVYRPHWSSNGAMLRSHRQGVEVASGQEAGVIVGGAGRPVVGRLTRAAGLPEFDLEYVRGQLRLQQPNPEFPEGFEEWDADRQRTWWYAFYETAEGRGYLERANAHVVKVEADGAFRLDDVPEGRYRLRFDYETESFEPGQEPTKPVHNKVAVLEMYLDIPAGPDEKPLDLGTLTLTPPEPELIDR